MDKCPSSDEFPESSAVAGGGAVLTADPCENSVRGIFNVTDAAVLAAQAGDPRWLVAYVPEPMADLVPVEYGYKWNLTDKSAFGQSVDATSVINNLKFIVDENPVNILDNGMEFTAEAALQYGGVPTDCAISFMVSGPGSIFASTALSSSGSSNDHLTVALGDAEGNGAEVVGAVYAGATNQKLVFEDIPAGENRLVYVYACGPVVLTGMEWSDDVNTGSSALKDPEVTADVSTAGALKLSWPAVENAGSYIISFGAKEADAEYAEDEYTVTATSPEYTWENFPSGTYTVNVQAVPAEPDKFDNSMIVGTSVTVAAPALTNMSSGTLTQDDFRFISAIVGTDKLAKGHVITYKNFMFTENKGDKVSFGVDSNFGAYYSTGGSSSVKADAAEASQTIRFLAAGAGKLTVVATSTSTLDPEKPRRVSYGINGTKSDVLYEVPGKPSGALDPETSTFSFDISAAAGDAIDIYGDANIYVMNVTWVPLTEGWPSDESAINEEYIKDFKEDVAEFPEQIFTGQASTVGKFTIMPRTSDEKTKFEDGKLKFGGASKYDEETMIPTDRYLSFKITQPGTIYHKSAASGDSGERHFVIALLLPSAEEAVVLYDEVKTTDGDEDFIQTEVTEQHLAGITEAATVYCFCYVNAVNIEGMGFVPAAL